MSLISNYVQGKFTGSQDIVGVSDVNEYYPVYTIFNGGDYRSSNFPGDHKVSENIVGNTFLYRKPSLENVNYIFGINKYSDLKAGFKNSLRLKVFKFSYAAIPHKIYFCKGYIADEEDNILMVLTTNSRNIFNAEGHLKHKHLKMFVANELITTEYYKNVFRKLNTMFLDYCYQNDIEVVFTSSKKIEKEVFKSGVNIKFSSITELNNILQSGIGENLSFDATTLINAYQSLAS